MIEQSNLKHLASNYKNVCDRISEFSAKFGVSVPRIICVTKKRPLDYIKFIAGLGQVDFGENYVQEGVEKILELKNSALNFHLIGHLQSNKAVQVAKYFDTVQTIDSLKLISSLQKIALPNFYLQVNPSESKEYGIKLKELDEFVAKIQQAQILDKFCGLMCIGDSIIEIGIDEKKKEFALIKEHTQRIASNFNLPNLKCSMGMSDDFQYAIEQGSDVLRIGSLFFN